MDAVFLSRLQFALTIGFHYIFPPVTIGLSWLIVWIMTRYKDTGADLYRRLAAFWIKIFGLSFAVGVATGITMEFQFGTNWAGYSRFVGDIFGAPLAAEVILAFFLESSFLGVLILGGERLSVRVRWFASLMVAFGSTLSAFWIIAANSWMQTPAGYRVVSGRVELTDLRAAIFNPSTIPRLLHTVDGALVTGAFFMLGIGAWFILKGRNTDFGRESVRVALITGFVFSMLQLPLGHYHAVQVALTQPEKLAAVEGLFETQRRAPALVFGIPSSKDETVRAAIRIPGALSLLAFGSLDAEVKGLKDFPKDEWPPLFLTFYPFHLMVMLGMYFIGFTALGIFLLWRRKLYGNRFFLSLAVLSIPLPFIANELGWISAEVGRQPWVVYKVMRTADAVSSSVSAGQVLFSIIMFTMIYGLLFFAWIFLIFREIRMWMATEGDSAVKEVMS
ncbi:MAG: cytochrome ubiquinol oxidase subunit I [bacterium]